MRLGRRVMQYAALSAVAGVFALLALLDGGWSEMLLVIAAYSIINFIIQSLIQPKFVADAVNITLTLSFVSVIFWTFVIGPLGAILAVPLTTAVLINRALRRRADAR